MGDGRVILERWSCNGHLLMTVGKRLSMVIVHVCQDTELFESWHGRMLSHNTVETLHHHFSGLLGHRTPQVGRVILQRYFEMTSHLMVI